jgi:GR25 family glycosyltransferase involved in LPS biosynthesis
MPSVQLLFVCVSEARRAHIRAQAARLSFPCVLLDAATPATSVEYLGAAGTDAGAAWHHSPRVLCSTRSHAAALAVAGAPDAPDFSVILEDDAALHEDFEVVVRALTGGWRAFAEKGIEFMSLGHMPHVPPRALPSSEGTVWLRGEAAFTWHPIPARDLRDRIWGVQAYLLPRAVAARLAAQLHHGTYAALDAVLRAHEDADVMARLRSFDNILPFFARQAALHPMLVVESQMPSTVFDGDGDASRAPEAPQEDPKWRQYFSVNPYPLPRKEAYWLPGRV